MSNFTQIITKLNEDCGLAVQKNTEESYVRLSSIVGELDKYLREYIQDLTEDDVKSIINKLRKGMNLSPEELYLVKLWIVGDADCYTRMEGNFEDWKAELKRLMMEINKLQVDNPNVELAFKLRGYFQDAFRVLSNIMYFAQQKDRVEKFAEATKEIDQEERQLLIRLLEQKIHSNEF